MSAENDKIGIGSRNYAIDLLRILSMLMIVRLHIGSHGNIIRYYGVDTFNGIVLRFVNIMCGGAVNIYVLISGYFLSSQKFRPSRLVKIAVEVIFYSWIILAVSFVRGTELGFSGILQLLLPISYKTYWFVTVYIGMVLVSPILNKVLATLDKTQHLMLIIVSLIVSSVLRDILLKSDPFDFNRGYSVIWFAVIYIIAYYLRHHFEVKKIKHPLLLYFVFCTFMMISWVVANKIGFLVQNEFTGNWLRYNSLFNILASVMLFETFLTINIKSKAVQKIISVIAPLTLGVYLIHDNPFMRNFVWQKIIRTNTFENDMLLIPKCAASVLAVFSVCLAIDWFRVMLFHSFDRSRWYRKVLAWFDELPYKVYNYLKRF